MKINIRKNEFIFFLVWAMYLTSYALFVESEIKYEYNIGSIYGYTLRLYMLLFAILAIKGKFNISRIPIILICALVILASMVGAHSPSFLMTLVVGLAMKDIELEHFIKFDIVVRILLLFVIFALCAFGVVENYAAWFNGTYKQALGFGHPNTLGLHIAVIVVEWMFIYFKKINFINVFILCCIVYLLYWIGTSRTAIILLCCSIFLAVLLKSKKIQAIFSGKVGCGIFTILPAVICTLCYLSAKLYNSASSLWLTLDSLFTTRLHWANYYLYNTGLSLFGTNIDPVSGRDAGILGFSQSSSFDMAYVRIGIEYGLIILVIFLICLMAVQNYAIKTKNWGLLIANTFYILLGMVENSLFSIAMNPFLVCIVMVIIGLFKENTGRANKRLKLKWSKKLL